MGAMQQAMMMVSAVVSGTFDNTAFTVDASDVSPTTVWAQAGFLTTGLASLSGLALETSTPASPKWWSSDPPPATWMEYSSTGTGTIRGGLTAGTRYQLNATRTVGIQTAANGSFSRTFTVSFYDAASGGTLVGTKTVTCNISRS